MKAMLTSSLGGASSVNGVRQPSVLIRDNGLLDNLRSIWPEHARVLILCGDPEDREKNDSVRACLRESLPMSGLGVSRVGLCDGRDPSAAEHLEDVDALILMGGHVPTQNRFMRRLRLKERLEGYCGIVAAWSAGSMNCADVVYAGPELEGEAVDPGFERWLPGLGITKFNIFPHFQSLKDDYLDGLRLIEDITFADSVGHEILALNDGSYLMLDEGKTTLYGEAYLIKDREIRQICGNGGCLSL